MNRIIRFTNAPVDYDYPRIVISRTELPYLDANGKPWFMLVLDADDADYQIGRYGSGLHPVWDADEFANEMTPHVNDSVELF